MPDMPRLGSGIPLVARSREMDRLRAAFEQAAAGSAGAVLVAGDAGIGKTRLTEELAALARDKDALVLTGRCLDAGEAGLAYLPFAEALAQIPDRAEAVRAHPGAATLFPESVLPSTPAPGSLVSGLALPIGGGPATRSEQDVGQLQLFDAVHGLLTDLAADRPVVLILEDLHWADGSTRRLLAFLCSRLRAQRLLIVGTYRSDDLHRRHPLRPLLAELVRLPAVERIEVPPFGPAEAREFVAALADGQVPEEGLREVATRSDGNAFFAEELITCYVNCGGGDTPATLVDVLLSRVERLSPAGQQVVRVASVSGRRVPHARLRAVADLAEAELEEALREAVQHYILVPEDGEVYAFRHALVREAVYGDLLPGERVRLHAAYARVLAAEPGARGAAAALAYHSMESHALPQALRASVSAAEEAGRQGAPAEALEHLERALNIWHVVAEADRPSTVDEAALLRRASWYAGASGEPERSVAYARSAVEHADESDPETAAEAHRRLAKALSALDGKEDEATEVIKRAWAMVAGRPATYIKAWVLAVYAVIDRRADRYERAREWAELAVRVAREANAPGAEADALTTLAALDESDGLVEQSRERLIEAMRRAAEANALTTELRARHYLGVNRYEQGLLAEAVRVVDEGVERAERTGLIWSGFGLELRVMQVITRYVTGDWAGAEAAAEPPGHRVSSTVSARLAAVGAHVMVARGLLAEAARAVADLRPEWDRELLIALTTGVVGAELAAWQGKPEQGLVWVRDALEHIRRAGAPWLLAGIRLGALGAAAAADLRERAMAQRRDADGVRAALEEGERLVEHARKTAELGMPRTGTLGPEGRAWLARAEAEASRLHGASDPELWRTAVAAFGFGAVYEQAICRWRLAEALLRVDRRDDAATELRAAHRVADRLGARPLRDAVPRHAPRGRIGLDDGEAPRPALDPFTPRERAVLGLVALGRTNRQAGAELFISEKTVSVHLSRIMAKLGASNRAEAVAIAAERGLLEQPVPHS
ncbi:MAG TPA: AAA family ATPase [Actinophytocola sp.]|uniref:ATP-binding protein n=1 Tax=Actinophytocola sp. TaxID=1872138 RepID=UPI002DDD7973|nr:AAA family ATPase [Actinophytocola sp.]HEV2778583.1 AAA family ATPase [Actinophytocola sp.]